MRVAFFSFAIALAMPAPAAERSALAIVAHRGASADAPENTVASLKLGFEQGADFAETDLWLSKDGRIVLLHDDNTKRISGVDRKVHDLTLAELKQLDAGSWKGAQFKGERIPTLEEGLATVPKGKGILLELKDDSRIIEPLAAALDKTVLKPEQIIIIGFDRNVVQAAKQRMPQYKVLWLVAFKKDKESGAWSPQVDDVIADAQSAGVDGLDIRADPIVDREFVNKARAAKLPLFYVWTVNDPKVASSMRAAGVDGITTDRPGELRKELEDKAR